MKKIKSFDFFEYVVDKYNKFISRLERRQKTRI